MGVIITVMWHEIQGVSYHQPHKCGHQFFQAYIKETSKVCITGPLWREFTSAQWIPLTEGQ